MIEYRSSPNVIRTFCGRCGSPLTYRNEHEPESIDIMLCSLDDPDTLPPTFRVWASQKLTWDKAAADLPAYEQSRTLAEH